jgi:plastocyanin
MSRKLQLIPFITLFMLISASCAELADKPTTQPVEQHEVEIRIDNFTFTPASVTITPGTRVTWINHDDVPHTATSTTKVFASKALDTDDKFSFVFAKPGTFDYFCAVHPHMTGRVIVK